MSKAEEQSDAPGPDDSGGEQSVDSEHASKPELVPPSAGIVTETADTGETAAPAPPATQSAVAETAAPATPNVADMAYAAFETPELSPEDAERYASRFRASWEPSSPVPVAVAVAERMRTANPAAVALPDAEFIVAARGAFPGAAHRGRGLLIASGVIVGFFALVALAFVMGTRGLPTTTQSAEHAVAAPAPTPAPAAPTIAQPVAPVPAAPVPAPVPTAATAPSEALPASAPAELSAENTAPIAAAPEPVAQPVPAAEPVAAAPAAPAPVVPDEPAAPALVAGAQLAQNTAPKKTVRVDIAASPASAQLTLDGERVSNPFEARAPKGGRHRVLAEAPGHRPRDLTLDFNRDQHLDIRLERLGAVKRVAPKHKSQPTAPRSQPKGAGFVSESPY